MRDRDRRRPWAVMALLLALALALGGGSVAASPAAAPASGPEATIEGPIVGVPVVPAVFNGDLRDLPQTEQIEQGEAPRAIRPLDLPAAPAGFVDPVAQTWHGTSQMPSPLITFEGQQGTDAGSWVPPDTNGDVGLTHYVQLVNVGIAMFDKATGTRVVQISFNDFFDGTGTLCDYSNRGDPIVLYDPQAGRWLISDFGWVGSSGPYYECIAVSQGEDPVSGGWYFYALPANPSDPNSLNDYPKLGVWPDAYYMSANMFYGSVQGARVWAMDREAMINGQPMNSVAFNLGSAYWSLLPSNLRGDPPPAGAPNVFASISQSPAALRLWEFHVDWDTPGNSTFTGPVPVSVAPWSSIWDIPQPAPGELVDSLGDRLMMQLQYRNLGTHQSLWANHTVASGGVAGVRWYEVRDPAGTPVLYQQGTYQPDSNYRWMGSVAVDSAGNMALGFSISSTSYKPSIHYAGRLVGDPLGTLPQGEGSIVEGTGVQLNGVGRWGDYSAMSVDPVDDCTFWYTQEYYKVNSDRNWQTHVGSFKFPSCSQPKIFVGDIQARYRILETVRYKLQGRVPILDENMNPVPGAQVTAQWELPDGRIVTRTQTTRANGSAIFPWGSTLEGLYVITVLDVQMDGYEYDPSMNLETSEEVMVP